MDGGAWWAAVHGIAKSQTQLSNFTCTFHFHALEKEMATHSSVLAWRIPGMGEPGGLPSMGSHRVGHMKQLRRSSSSNSITSLGSTSNCSSLATSITSAVTSSTEVFHSFKSFIRVGINFFQTPVNVDDASHDSHMFLMVSYFMVNPCQGGFQFTSLRSIRGITRTEQLFIRTALALGSIFLK